MSVNEGVSEGVRGGEGKVEWERGVGGASVPVKQEGACA